MSDLRKLPNSRDVIREASNKLKIVQHQRELEEKYFQKYEDQNECLNKFEENLSQSLYYNKLNSSNISEKTFSKIYILLEQFNKLEPTQISNISKILLNKSTSATQTDSTDESMLINKMTILEKSNEKLSKENNKLKAENEIIKKENEELKIENDKLNKQYIQLNHKIEEEEKIKNEINKELSKVKNDNLSLEAQIQQLNKLIEELKSKTKNYEEKIKMDLEKKRYDINFLNLYKNEENKITFSYLIKAKQANKIFEFLDANDIINYRLCCKDIHKSLNTENIVILNKFYLNIIKQKNEVIKKINKYDIKENYLTKLPQLEQLIKIYSLDEKHPGTGLKLSIDNSLFFLNKNVKAQLGLSESRPRIKYNKAINNINNNPTPQESQNTSTYDSFFGGFKNIFGFGSEAPKPQVMKQNNNNQISRSVMQSNIQSSKNSLNVSAYSSAKNSKNTSFKIPKNNKADFSESDELLLNEINNNDYGLKSNYEFDYNSPDDINMFLNKFLKSPFPVDKLTDFISKLCNNFSDLLYHSYITIKEVHQLEIVSKSLNERFKYYYDLNNKNEKIIKSLYIEKMANNVQNKDFGNKNINRKDLDDKKIEEGSNINISELNNGEENNLENLEKKLDLTQMNLNISNKKAELYEKKYEQIKSHFEQYKEMTKEENNNLKYQVDLISKEKNEMEKKIKELNNFFNQLLEGDNKDKILN